MTKIHEGAAVLGKMAALPASPDEAELDLVPNPHKGETYLVRFTAPEFTSLCPVTGQPDFAHLVIDYVPKAFLVESKSLKLYLASFRNHAGFHESTTLEIGKRLRDTLKPLWALKPYDNQPAFAPLYAPGFWLISIGLVVVWRARAPLSKVIVDTARGAWRSCAVTMAFVVMAELYVGSGMAQQIGGHRGRGAELAGQVVGGGVAGDGQADHERQVLRGLGLLKDLHQLAGRIERERAHAERMQRVEKRVRLGRLAAHQAQHAFIDRVERDLGAALRFAGKIFHRRRHAHGLAGFFPKGEPTHPQRR